MAKETYKVALNEEDKLVFILEDGKAAPSGSTEIGSFEHDKTDEGKEKDTIGHGFTHTFYQHVADVLYREKGIQDVHKYAIYVNAVPSA